MFRRIRAPQFVLQNISSIRGPFGGTRVSPCICRSLNLATSTLLFARGAGHRSTPSSSSWFGKQQFDAGTQIKKVFDPVASGGGSQSTMDSLSPQVRQHLVRVYSLLAVGVGLAAVGSASMFLTPLGKIVPFWFPLFGGMVPLFWLMLAPPSTVNGRLMLFYSFAALEGMALAPIVLATFAKGVLFTALVLTGAVFGGFTAAALLAPRAKLIALQGPLYGVLLGMVAVSLLSLIWPTAIAHSIVLYGGLALFSALVAVDTQAMIERARCGAGDHVMDALSMFLNVINIFVRIAEILRHME